MTNIYSQNRLMIKKQKNNGLEPSLQIHQPEGFQNGTFRSSGQLAHYPAQFKVSFALTEFAFNTVSRHFVLVYLFSDFPVGF